MKNRFVSLVHPDSQEMSDPNLVPKLVGAKKVCSLGIKRAFGVFRDVKTTRSMMNDSRCFVRAGFFNQGIASVSAVTAASSSPSTSTSYIPTAHSLPLLNHMFDWSTDAKSKLKFGVVFATMEQQVLYL